MRYIVLPQAIRTVIPPLCNTVAIIEISDLMRQTMILSSETFRPFKFYTATAVIYYILTFAIARLVAIIERKMHSFPGGAQERRLSRRNIIPS
jgi:ABC-type amino acid transport system permease subunit